MKWQPVDIVVGSIIGLLVLVVCFSFALRVIGIAPLGDNVLEAIENLTISTVAIISLYVGSRLNNKEDDNG